MYVVRARSLSFLHTLYLSTSSGMRPSLYATLHHTHVHAHTSSVMRPSMKNRSVGTALTP